MTTSLRAEDVCRFRMLPRELRDIIYTHLGAVVTPQGLNFGGVNITGRHVYSCSTHSCNLQANDLTVEDTSGLFTLMRTNKFFRNELLELVYENATLVVEAAMPFTAYQTTHNGELTIDRDGSISDPAQVRSLVNAPHPEGAKYVLPKGHLSKFATLVIRPWWTAPETPFLELTEYTFIVKEVASNESNICRVIMLFSIQVPDYPENKWALRIGSPGMASALLLHRNLQVVEICEEDEIKGRVEVYPGMSRDQLQEELLTAMCGGVNKVGQWE